jgi:hypothetical protein
MSHVAEFFTAAEAIRQKIPREGRMRGHAL